MKWVIHYGVVVDVVVLSHGTVKELQEQSAKFIGLQI